MNLAQAPESLQLAALGEHGPEFVIAMDEVWNKFMEIQREKAKKEAEKKRKQEKRRQDIKDRGRAAARANKMPMRG